MFERILVTLDGSRFGARAIPYAVEVAKRFGGELLLLEVVPPTAVTLPTAMAPAEPMVNPEATRIIVQSAREQDKRNVARANRYLKKKQDEIAAAGVRAYAEILSVR
ncbi:MAG: hypothetical protein A2147_05915 [Chloroflexi bacterium RBG_16_57_8]|nr:MAG: hypothetical protein A2147_05915 [Chloroflexi bacterium RBG_16_57_8]